MLKQEDFLFILNRDDLRCCLTQMGLNPDLADDFDFFHDVRNGIEFGLEFWEEVMRTAIQEALKIKGGEANYESQTKDLEGEKQNSHTKGD